MGRVASSLRERIEDAGRRAARRLNRPRVYRARRGLGRGFKQIGGVRLALPARGAQSAEEAFLRRLNFEDMTVFDIGCFHGVLTLFFAGRVGPGGRVLAFEPHPDNYRRILTNVGLNDDVNVAVHNVAVGQAPGRLDLAGPPGGGGTATANDEFKSWYSSHGERLETVTVPVVAIDDEVASASIPDPDFVKIDVEGMEMPVLLGMSETITRCKPKLFVEIHGAGIESKRANAASVIEFLADCDYALHHVESGTSVDPGTSERAAEGHIYCE